GILCRLNNACVNGCHDRLPFTVTPTNSALSLRKSFRTRQYSRSSALFIFRSLVFWGFLRRRLIAVCGRRGGFDLSGRCLRFARVCRRRFLGGSSFRSGFLDGAVSFGGYCFAAIQTGKV